MPSVFSRAKELLVDVPRHGKLAYCLLRDDRVPAAPKAALLAALGVIVSPLDLGILAVETFIAACPEEVREEHQAAIKAKESTFDRDWHDTAGAARYAAGRMVNRVRLRVLRREDEYQSASEGQRNGR